MSHAIENTTKRILELNPRTGRQISRSKPMRGKREETFRVRLGSRLDNHVKHDTHPKIKPPRRVLSDQAYKALMADPIAGPAVRGWVSDRTLREMPTDDAPDIRLPIEIEAPSEVEA